MFNVLTLQRIKSSTSLDDSHYSYVGADYPTELPLNLDTVAMTLENVARDHRYSQTGSHAWLEWYAIDRFPRGHGFVHLGPHSRSFGVGMFHQIHCLEMIREALIEGPNEHAGHCMNFLRQGVLCNADTTLETGAEVTHVCRDWTQVYDYVTENQETW